MDLEALQLLDELRKRQEHKFNKYKPNPKQEEFHQSTKYIRLLFGGNQSGKSHCNAQECAWWLTKKHPYRKLPDRPVMLWVISTEYQTIRAGIYRHLKDILPPWEIDCFGSKVQGHDLHAYIKMKNGSTCYFLSSKGGEDARTKFQAEAVDYIAIDEEIEEYIWDECQARLLATGGCFGISATLVESYEWIVQLEQRALANDSDIFLTRLDTTENPYLNQEQVQRLEAKWDDDTKEYRLRGKSRRKTGLVYPYFEHWTPRFDIPDYWTKYHVLDPGFRTCAGLWAAITEYGQCVIYRELYQQYSDLHHVADEIKAVEKEEVDFRIIDDKEGSHTLTGAIGPMTILANEYNLFYTPAIKSKLAGIEAVRATLRKAKTEEFYKYPNGLELPKGQILFVFNDLEHFKYELVRYRINPDKARRDKNSSIDEPIKTKDHLMDAWRYLSIVNPSYYPRNAPSGKREPFGTGDIIELFEKIRERNKVHVDEFMGQY